jgi:uncharacterized protein YoxC
VIASLGGWAAIFVAAFWGIVALALVYAFIQLAVVLQMTTKMIDDLRKETVPLLREVTGTVTGVNKELDRVDGMVESAGNIVRNVERISTVVEQTVSSPLIKVAAFGAGAARAMRKLGKKKE